MNNNCIVCLTSGQAVPAIHDNKLCQHHMDEALAAIVALDRRRKTESVPYKVAERRERAASMRRATAKAGV